MNQTALNNLDKFFDNPKPEEGGEVARLLKIVRMKRWLILTITAITFTLSLIYVFSLPDVYSGVTKILIEKMDEETPTKFEEFLIPKGDSGSIYYQTQVALMQSRSILEQTAEDLNLAGHYRRFVKNIQDNRQAARILRRNLKVQISRGTQILEVQVKDRNSQWAAKLANQVSENYVKETLKARLFVSDQILKWFPENARALQDGSAMAQLQKLSDKEITASLPSVMRDPVINQIKKEMVDLDAEIRELSRRYTDAHPKMKELREKAVYLDSEMKAQTEKILTGLKASLAGAFNVTNVRVVENAEVPLSPSGPPRILIIFACTFLGLSVSVMLSILLANFENNIKSEEDVRRIPLPFLGYIPLLQASDKVSGFKDFKGLIDSSASIIKDMISDKSGDPSAPKDFTPLKQVGLSDDKGVIDEIANVRAAIVFSLPAARNKVLMFTSAVPEEGKTTAATLLAMSIADYGEKVLLVDADMRKPSLHKIFGLPCNPGLSNCLIGSRSPEEVVVNLQSVGNIDVMTAGEKSPNPGMLLSSDAIRQFLTDLRAMYDRIIIDVPPALHIPDAWVLSQYVDGTILVFGSNMVHLSVAQKLAQKFTASNAAVVGAIINRADYKNLDGYYDYSYYRYYNRYRKYYRQEEGKAVEAEKMV